MQKETILDNIRTPIVDTIYQSPFDGLVKHSDLIDECILNIKKCLHSYLKGDFDKADEYTKKLKIIEHEADLIKANTRAHIPRSIFFTVSKREFLHLLHDSDSILDYAEDVAVLLTMKRTNVPQDIADGMKDLMDVVIQCVSVYQEVMSHMNKLVKVSFRGEEREKVKKLIKDIHHFEHKADAIEFKISKELFNTDPKILDPISIVHLLKVVDRTGGIADKAQNAGERVRALLAK